MDKSIRSLVDSNKVLFVLVIIGVYISLGIATKNLAVGLGVSAGLLLLLVISRIPTSQ
jgi:hypothetical protein